MPNDTTLPFLPNFPADSATLTKPLPKQLYRRGDTVAPAEAPDAAAPADPADKAVDAALRWGFDILLKDQGHLLGEWLGQILGFSAERAGIGDSDGIGLRQVPHDEMIPDASAALDRFLDANPKLAPLVRVDPDRLATATAVLLFRRYLLSVIERARAVFARGVLVSTHEVAGLLEQGAGTPKSNTPPDTPSAPAAAGATCRPARRTRPAPSWRQRRCATG